MKKVHTLSKESPICYCHIFIRTKKKKKAMNQNFLKQKIITLLVIDD